MRRNLYLSIIPVAGIILIISLLSAMSSVMIIYDSAEYPYGGSRFTDLPGIWLLLVCLASSAGAVLTVMWVKWALPDIHEALSAPNLKKWPLILFLVLMAIPVLFSMAADSSLASANSVARMLAKFVHYTEKFTGGTLGFVLAVITLVGFYLTVQQLLDFQRRITSFPDLMARVIRLSESATSDDKMHIIAYTPAVGFLAQPTLWRKVRAAMCAPDSRQDQSYIRTKILTQEEQTLRQWHQNFLDRQTKRIGGRKIGQEQIDNANHASMELKSLLNAGQDKGYIEVPMELLPGYYCFFTTQRAIIVDPLFLPPTSQMPLGTEQLAALQPPHMIGFETTDRNVIDNLSSQFTYIEEINRARVAAAAKANG